MESNAEGQGPMWPCVLLFCTASFLFFSLRYRLQRWIGAPSENRRIPRNDARDCTLPMCVQDGDIVSAIARNVFASVKICITWEVLGCGDTWKEGGERAMEFLVSFPEIFIMVRVSDEVEQKKMVRFLRRFGEKGLERDRVLFCTTGAGYRAFVRQLNPVVLISHEPDEAEFLSRILPHIVLVNEKNFAIPNIQSIPSILALTECL